MEDNPTKGGLSSPSEEDLGRMIREGVRAWQPKVGADWPALLMRVAGSGPPAWVLYTAASAALVLILLTAFLVGSALQIGALAPQSIPSNIGH